MKKLVLLLLIGLLGAVEPVAAQNKPKKAKRAFAHQSETGKGKADKSQFRREKNGPSIDLTPHKMNSFKTTKVKHYKYAKAR